MENCQNTDFDNIVIASQPFYGMRIPLLLKKIEYLEQKLFWMRVSTSYSLMRLTYIHQLFISRRSFTPDDPENHPPEKLWKTEFENFLNTHDITFAPGNALDIHLVDLDQIKLRVANISTHLCSGIDGNWRKGIGFGLLFFSNSRERQKYMRIVELLSSRVNDHSEKFYVDHDPIYVKTKPLEMINFLCKGFDDHYQYLDNLVLSCQGLYNPQVSNLRQKIFALDTRIFINIVDIMKWDVNSVAAVHHSTYNKDIRAKEMSWETEIEMLLDTYQLMVKPGKVSEYIMNGVRIFLNKETPSHICSGCSGNWDFSSNQGFGALMLSDVNAQKRYLKFARHVYSE